MRYRNNVTHKLDLKSQAGLRIHKRSIIEDDDCLLVATPALILVFIDYMTEC